MLSLSTLARVRAIACLLAVIGLVAAAPSAADAAAPTPSEVTALIDGRIPALTTIDAIVPNADGTRLALLIGFRDPDISGDGFAIWVLDADGTDLSRIDWIAAGSSFYGRTLSAPKWWSYGSGIDYTRYGTTPPRSQPMSINLSGVGPMYQTPGDEIAGGRYVVGPIGDGPRPGLDLGYWIRDRATNVQVDAIHTKWSVDGVRTTTWTDACRGAAAAGVDPLGGPAVIEAQLTAPSPGCRFDAWPTPPSTPLEVETLLAGRIPGLRGITQINVSPSGTRIAFRAGVRYETRLDDETEIWVVNADGSGLLLVAALPVGAAQHLTSVAEPKWWTTSQGLTYMSYQLILPRSSAISVDLSSGTPVVVPTFTELAGGRFRAGKSDAEDKGFGPYTGGYWVRDVASGATIRATEATFVDGDKRVPVWTDACRGAAKSGADPLGGFAAIEAQLAAAKPGCRFDAVWPAEPPAPVEPKTTPAPAVTATPAANAPAAVLSTTPTLKPIAFGTILSLRATRRGAIVNALRVKLEAKAGTRIKLWLISARSGSKTLARGSVTARGGNIVVVLPIGPAAARAAQAVGAKLQLRMSATDAAGNQSVTTRALAPLR